MKEKWSRLALGTALALLGATGVVRAQSASADPWGRVPAVPAGCYYEAADFERFSQAEAAMAAEYTRQKKVNDDLTNEFNKMDMSVKMQRMQAFMMKDPQKAMAMMQGMQASAGRMTAQAQTSSTELPKLDQDLDALHAKFKGEVGTLLKPIDDRAAAFFNAHKAKGEAGDYIPNKADEAQYLAILHEKNVAYEKMCAAWWGPGSQVQGWLGRYKTLLTTEATSYETNDATLVVQMQIMDSPSGGYRSLYQAEAARKYTEKVRTIMEQRPDKQSVSTGWMR